MNDNLPPLPCPFCGEQPKTTERPDNIDGTQFFFAVGCYCGTYSASAHKMAVRNTPEQAMSDAISAWNTRAAIERQSVPAGWYITKAEAVADAEEQAALAAAPQPQPVQPTPTIKDYLIVQSTVPLPADFLQFWQAINPKAMTRRVLALTAWNISKHEAKKQFKTMTISKTFDNSNAENLTILDLSDKVFLRDLSTQAKEMAESPGCTPAWAATYMALEASASMLADLIENTEVRDA